MCMTHLQSYQFMLPNLLLYTHYKIVQTEKYEMGKMKSKPSRTCIDMYCYTVQPQGFMETSIRYVEVTDIVALSPWDAGHKHCIQLTFADGNSVLLQVSKIFQKLFSLKNFRDRRVTSIRLFF